MITLNMFGWSADTPTGTKKLTASEFIFLMILATHGSLGKDEIVEKMWQGATSNNNYYSLLGAVRRKVGKIFTTEKNMVQLQERIVINRSMPL